MTDRIDHAAEATESLRRMPEAVQRAGAVSADALVKAAQVHALLALVEQQRISNLIALEKSRSWLSRHANKTLTGDIDDSMNPEIAAALGIETGAGDE